MHEERPHVTVIDALLEELEELNEKGSPLPRFAVASDPPWSHHVMRSPP